jgi:hypothetical protein
MTKQTKDDAKKYTPVLKKIAENASDYYNTKVDWKILRDPMKRGIAAWRTGHRTGANAFQWGYARVYSFLVGGKAFFTSETDVAKKLPKKLRNKILSEAVWSDTKTKPEKIVRDKDGNKINPRYIAGLSPQQQKDRIKEINERNKELKKYEKSGGKLTSQQKRKLNRPFKTDKFLKTKPSSYTVEAKNRGIAASSKKGAANKQYKIKYKNWVSLKDVLRAVPAMEKLGVSEVARGVKDSSRTKEGFIEAYKATKGSIPKMQSRLTGQGDQTWAKRRDEFIARHVGQMRSRDTYKTGWKPNGEPTRRHLGLIAWAYSPSPKRLAKWLETQPKGSLARKKRKRVRRTKKGVNTKYTVQAVTDAMLLFRKMNGYLPTSGAPWMDSRHPASQYFGFAAKWTSADNALKKYFGKSMQSLAKSINRRQK